MHSMMLARVADRRGLISLNQCKESFHHSQWFSTGIAINCLVTTTPWSAKPLRLLADYLRRPVTFSQFKDLSDLTRRTQLTQRTLWAKISDDHAECRSICMCRTRQRNPQLTHRTILLSPYRSTSESSYIRGRGGLGDQLADGVWWSSRKLLPGFLSPLHYEVPGFEVRSKRNDTHWVGLQPAANFCPNH